MPWIIASNGMVCDAPARSSSSELDAATNPAWLSVPELVPWLFSEKVCVRHFPSVESVPRWMSGSPMTTLLLPATRPIRLEVEHTVAFCTAAAA